MLTEKTLDQILGVLELTRKYYHTGLPVTKAYQKSVKDIAHRYSVRYQTIADGCRRRLYLDNVEEFIKLLSEWLVGKPLPLKELLIKNIGELDKYKVENFFDQPAPASTSKTVVSRNVEEIFEVVTFKAPRNIVSQLRVLAEAEEKSVQEFMNILIKQYVDEHYLAHVKNLINALPPKEREQIITDLSNSMK